MPNKANGSNRLRCSQLACRWKYSTPNTSAKIKIVSIKPVDSLPPKAIAIKGTAIIPVPATPVFAMPNMSATMASRTTSLRESEYERMSSMRLAGQLENDARLPSRLAGRKLRPALENVSDLTIGYIPPLAARVRLP